ncbi:regulator of cell morphogenesis and NO signaling [Roseomonas rosea]|uniref:Regulator of cell morphogenesis and NO signaling n=1 Tax=Muricoccus roseus TaxID=198092 RepID=A0A1M6N3Y9_9PROT|nr:iron-sulfur cluster repair protein YtfE [Roseomonas rosea]SHJ90397.1 regulator of cell morphogenesis and NO signaling [Roseomonas rosea]
MSVTTEPGFATRRIAEIATALPGSTAVFRKHKLDFCCGGDVPLAEAAAKRGASLSAVEAELAALLPHQAETRPEDTDALISLIETRYHATHRRELPELIRLARRVEAVHGEKLEAPRGLADLLEDMGAELESHMQKEEQILFPLMRDGGHPMIGHPIAMMRHEHDDHGEHLRMLEALTNHGEAPPGACNTWRALYAGTRKLADDLMEHIHLENNILFPRFEARR